MVAEFGRGCFVCERCCEFLLLLDEQSQSRNTQHQIVTEQTCKKGDLDHWSRFLTEARPAGLRPKVLLEAYGWGPAHSSSRKARYGKSD
jgi:hypothetical protein